MATANKEKGEGGGGGGGGSRERRRRRRDSLFRRADASPMARLMEGVHEHLGLKTGMTNDLLERLSFLMLDEDDGDCGYVGVFSADKIPPQLAARSRFAFLVNLDPWDEGEKREALRRQDRRPRRRRRHDDAHFVCVYGVGDQVTYLDSYGMKPKQRHVRAFLKSCRRPLAYNTKQVQDFGSAYCGLYALLFLLRLAKRKTAAAAAAGDALRFHSGKGRLRRNDDLCLRYLLQLAQQ